MVYVVLPRVAQLPRMMPNLYRVARGFRDYLQGLFPLFLDYVYLVYPVAKSPQHLLFRLAKIVWYQVEIRAISRLDYLALVPLNQNLEPVPAGALQVEY